MQPENNNSNTKLTMDKLVALCKNRGYIYAGSEIYGGLANTWDFGPLGVEFENNVKRAWWIKFVQELPKPQNNWPATKNLFSVPHEAL